MMLRSRQRTFVDKCSLPLKERGNTLGVAPTGAGKTIMMAAMGLENCNPELPTLIAQHRDELVGQNRDKFVQYAGIRNIRRPMTIDANNKYYDDAPGGWNFGMVQTMARNLDAIPKIGLLMIDEAHHCAAPTYLSLITAIKAKNPECLIYGTTATPNRGDRKALRTVFDNCGDQIPIGDLIRAGHLIRPRTFVIDLGVNQELAHVKKKEHYDMGEIERILNSRTINDRVFANWQEKAGDRQTVGFCATIQHAIDVCGTFTANGIKAGYIASSPHMTIHQRREVLRQYEAGELQALFNVSILTEGWDDQKTSCVLLLRKESWKSTMTQMIGRGLRKVDPELYPGVIKDDCIVLDFGTSCLIHGSLEEEVELSGSGIKKCPSCLADVPQNSKECPICAHKFPIKQITCPKCERQHDLGTKNCMCGHVFPATQSSSGGDGGMSVLKEGDIPDFVMTEIDILEDSPFKYESFYDGRVMLCYSMRFWAAVINYQDGRFYAIGAQPQGENNYALHILNSSDNYLMALQSADDYMRTNGNKTDANKVKKWVYEQPTSKQIDILAKGEDPGARPSFLNMSKYRACCGIHFKFYGNQMRAAIDGFINAQ